MHRSLLLLLPLLAVACVQTEEEELLDVASHDLKCDSVEVRDTQTVEGEIERYSVYGCGHEAVYECHEKRVSHRAYWTCSRSNYRFPV